MLLYREKESGDAYVDEPVISYIVVLKELIVLGTKCCVDPHDEYLIHGVRL